MSVMTSRSARSRLMLLAGAAAIVGGLATSPTPAHAEGFLAGVARQMGVPRELTEAADRAHAQAGRPLDRAANKAAGAAAGAATGNPAAGAAVTEALEARDAARRNGFGPFGFIR